MKSSPLFSPLIIGCLAAFLIFPGCAGRRGPGEPTFPAYQDFPGAPPDLVLEVETAILQSPYGLVLDSRSSQPGRLVTYLQALPLAGLEALAAPGQTALRGKKLRATLQLVITIREAPGVSTTTRVRVEPTYRVYLSLWGDRRQWIEWRSNGTLERRLLADIAEFHESAGPKRSQAPIP